jgi:hypothetical protein
MEKQQNIHTVMQLIINRKYYLNSQVKIMEYTQMNINIMLLHDIKAIPVRHNFGTSEGTKKKR